MAERRRGAQYPGAASFLFAARDDRDGTRARPTATRQRMDAILRWLEAQFPTPLLADFKPCSCWWRHPQRTVYGRTRELVTPTLFARFRTARDFADADPEVLEAIIRPTGFYRNKTRSLIGMGRALAERYGGEVPRTMDELTTVPGAGRKTANVVLGNAFGVEAGVATHVAHRQASAGT
jgi:hypothetical protein